MSPRKVRLVLDLVRGKYVDDAVAILDAVPNRAARVVSKLVQSASANAENNHQASRDSLKVGGAFADPGPTLKRIQPRAMGRAYRIIKRTSHITVIIDEAEPKPAARRLARTVTRADARGRKGQKTEEAPAKPGKARRGKAAEEPVAEETTEPQGSAQVEETAAEPDAQAAEESPQQAAEEPEAPAAENDSPEASEAEDAETRGDS